MAAMQRHPLTSILKVATELRSLQSHSILQRNPNLSNQTGHRRRMRLLAIFLVLLQLALSIAAVAPQRQVLITYPNDTPPSELADAKSAIEEAVGFVSRAMPAVLTLTVRQGGRVLHEFGKLDLSLLDRRLR